MSLFRHLMVVVLIAAVLPAVELESNSGLVVKRPRLDIPGFGEDDHRKGSGAYTGFNSVESQEIYIAEKQSAARSQIARGWGKPMIVRLPSGDAKLYGKS